MRTVRDREDDREYLLVTQSSESSRVRDPTSGEERYLPTDRLVPLDASPLDLAATAVDPAVRQLLRAVPGDRALGLLLELDRRGPVAVVDLMGSYDLCESDMLGLVTGFRAAGLVVEADVAGQPGYDTTETAAEALDRLRAPPAGQGTQ